MQPLCHLHGTLGSNKVIFYWLRTTHSGQLWRESRSMWEEVAQVSLNDMEGGELTFSRNKSHLSGVCLVPSCFWVLTRCCTGLYPSSFLPSHINKMLDYLLSSTFWTWEKFQSTNYCIIFSKPGCVYPQSFQPLSSLSGSHFRLAGLQQGSGGSRFSDFGTQDPIQHPVAGSYLLVPCCLSRSLLWYICLGLFLPSLQAGKGPVFHAQMVDYFI